jgi:hypothetical protein
LAQQICSATAGLSGSSFTRDLPEEWCTAPSSFDIARQGNFGDPPQEFEPGRSERQGDGPRIVASGHADPERNAALGGKSERDLLTLLTRHGYSLVEQRAGLGLRMTAGRPIVGVSNGPLGRRSARSVLKFGRVPSSNRALLLYLHPSRQRDSALRARLRARHRFGYWCEQMGQPARSEWSPFRSAPTELEPATAGSCRNGYGKH